MPISISFFGALSSSAAAGTYLKLDASNDPVTNEVKISPSSDAYSLDLQKDMRIKAGEKIYLDGA